MSKQVFPQSVAVPTAAPLWSFTVSAQSATMLNLRQKMAEALSRDGADILEFTSLAQVQAGRVSK